MLTIPAAFPTVAQCEDAVQSVKVIDEATRAALAEDIAQNRQNAYNEIVTRLTSRGYTQTQIDVWDRLYEFGRHLFLWWTFRDHVSAQQGDFPKEQFEHWDRREELDEVTITTDGGIVEPSGSGQDLLYGDLDFSAQIYNMDQQW